MIRADSIRHTASIARWAAAVSVSDVITPGAEHLTDVALAVTDHLPEPPGQLQRLVLRPTSSSAKLTITSLDSVNGPSVSVMFAAGRDHVGAAVKAARGQQHSGPGQFLDEAPHLGEELLVRGRPPPLTVIRKRIAGPPGKVSPLVSIWPIPVRSVSSKPDNNAGRRRSEETTMRKIVAGLFISLDGVVESPKEWMGP